MIFPQCPIRVIFIYEEEEEEETMEYGKRSKFYSGTVLCDVIRYVRDRGPGRRSPVALPLQHRSIDRILAHERAIPS